MVTVRIFKWSDSCHTTATHENGVMASTSPVHWLLVSKHYFSLIMPGKALSKSKTEVRKDVINDNEGWIYPKTKGIIFRHDFVAEQMHHLLEGQEVL